jgi:serralysin
MTDNAKLYCMCLTKGDLPASDQQKLAHYRAAVLKNARWQVGDKISIRFLGGDPTLQARVRAVASVEVAYSVCNQKEQPRVWLS